MKRLIAFTLSCVIVSSSLVSKSHNASMSEAPWKPGVVTWSSAIGTSLLGALEYSKSRDDQNPFSLPKCVLFSLMSAIPGLIAGAGAERYQYWARNDMILKTTSVTKFCTLAGGSLPLLIHILHYLFYNEDFFPKRGESVHALVRDTESAVVAGALVGYIVNLICNLHELVSRPVAKSEREYYSVKSSPLLEALYALTLEHADWDDYQWNTFWNSQDGESLIRSMMKKLNNSSLEEFYMHALELKNKLYGFIDYLELQKKYHPSLYGENAEISFMKKWTEITSKQCDAFLPYLKHYIG